MTKSKIRDVHNKICAIREELLEGAFRANGHRVDYPKWAAHTGMHFNTVRNKMENPCSIRLSELYELADAVGMDVEITLRQRGVTQ